MGRQKTNTGARLRPDSAQECRQSIRSVGVKRCLLNFVWARLASGQSRSSQLHKHVRLDDPNLAFENNLALSRRTASVDPTDARKSAALNVGREVDPASFIAVRIVVRIVSPFFPPPSSLLRFPFHAS